MEKISVISLEMLDSTSSHLSHLIKDGKHSLPLAVTSRSQTKGRGRQGREWVSPAGNLYLSLAFAAENLDKADLPLVPIYVAPLIADWVQKRFGFRVTLKWPNDILFSGSKRVFISFNSP